MAMCDACTQLSKQDRSTPAHAALHETGKTNLSKASHGRATGFVHHYECIVCGTLISCDCDDKDPDAGWYVRKPG